MTATITPANFRIKSTSDANITFQKTLLSGPPGIGKTTQAKFLQKKYGKTLILNCENGLSSISGESIDVLTFSRYYPLPQAEEEAAAAAGDNSIIGLMYYLKNFAKDEGYKVLVVDSITKASSFILAEAEKVVEAEKKKENKYQRHNVMLMNFIETLIAFDWCHVVCLALEKKDTYEHPGRPESGEKIPVLHPYVQGSKIVDYLMGPFDNVWAMKKEFDAEDPTKFERVFITSSYMSHTCKTRDWNKPTRLQPREAVSDMTTLMSRLTMSPEQWAKANIVRAKEEEQQKQTAEKEE